MLQKGFDNYTVRIDIDKYSTYESTFSYDSLLLYSSSPLIIEFQRNTGPDCLGGSHVGDVLLSNQEDVDDFGKKCYSKIEGSLKIGNLTSNETLPIIDLSPLETLREITQDLIIINNPELTSLMGLQYVEKVINVHLEKNQRLLTFEGLRRLNSIHSYSIVDNNSLTNLGGLPWKDITLSDLTISENKNLLNLNGLEELSQISHIHIQYNQKLNTINLPNITETSPLSIVGNNSLTSLSGFNNSISLLSSLHIRKNPRLKDFKGILAADGKISNVVSIMENASITSLEGLRLSTNIWNLVIESNPLLNDISALVDTREIDIYLKILNNDQLKNLNGLENLMSVGDPWSPLATPDLSILNNKSLTDFCALTNLFQNEIPSEWSIDSNAFNPTASDMLNGKCAP